MSSSYKVQKCRKKTEWSKEERAGFRSKTVQDGLFTTENASISSSHGKQLAEHITSLLSIINNKILAKKYELHD